MTTGFEMTTGAASISSMNTADETQKMQQPLGMRNYANLVGYICVIVVSAIQAFGGLGLKNGDLSDKYATLISPNSGAFLIWGVIFVWEGVAIGVHMLPKYRHSNLTVAMTPWWLATCFFQCAWAPVFSQELIIASEVLLVATWVPLVGLIAAADRTSTVDAVEFWAVRAGFSIHCGWVAAANAVGANIGLDYLKYDPETLLAVAVYSLGVTLVITILSVVFLPKPDVGVCLVIAWACYWINFELNETLDGNGPLTSPIRHNPYDWVQENQVVVQGIALAVTFVRNSALFLAAVAGVVRWSSISTTFATSKAEV